MNNTHEIPPYFNEYPEIRFGKPHITDNAFQSIPARFSRELEPVIEEDSLIEDAVKSIPALSRLNFISQLGHLRLVGDRPENSRDYATSLLNRYVHTLQTARNVEYILKNNGFDDDQVTHGIVAALLHDIGTPAGGDATKRLDPDNLHEEYHWQECVQDESSRAFFERRRLNPQLLDESIKNQGILGQVLDIADKLAYVTEDVSSIGGFPTVDDYLSYKHFKGTRLAKARPKARIFDFATESERELIDAMMANPDMGDLVKDVRIDDENGIYFTNPRRLYGLLKTRALMSKNVYLHPYNQALNMVFENILRPMYTTDSAESSPFTITPQYLRSITDWQLNDDIHGFWELKRTLSSGFQMFQDLHPKTIDVESPQEAENVSRKLEEDPQIVVLGTETIGKIKTGTDWKVKVPDFTLSGKHNGEIVPFNVAYPDWSETVDSIAESIPRTYVAYYEFGQPDSFGFRNTKYDEIIGKVYGRSIDQS